ncbi:tetratricopeptide repeat protein [Pseudomonas sp. IT-P4]|uniref:tetratricopeptide repeat protein n=1 Tax=Pseudomonas sp. IT-P4 TaxID=3026446 RepID=UPI0039E006D7
MYIHADALTSLFNLLNTLGSLITQLNDEQKAARKKGLQLYNLGEYRESEAYLMIAATAGDRDSQYALAQVITLRERSLKEEDKTHAEREWYVKAGAQGDVRALLRLADETSLAKAKELAEERADHGDSEAMLQLYELTKDIEWMKKSAEAGFLEAQYSLAVHYDNDHSLIPNTDERETAIDGWLKRAADAGFPKAIHWYSNRPHISHDLPVRKEWLLKWTETNDVWSLRYYAYALGGAYHDKNGIDVEYGLEENLVNAYGLMWLIMESHKEFKGYQNISDVFSQIAETLSETDKAAGKAFAQEWKRTHPPMSEYRLTYSDPR